MQECERSALLAVASRTAERAQEYAAKWNIPESFGSYESLLEDPRIDVIYNSLPNDLHCEWTVKALRAGKHVLCEKPLAMSADEAREMIAACDRNGVLLMEAFMYRLHPMWRAVLRLVEEGAIGELVAVDSVFSYFNDDPGNIRNIRDAGGGALYDIGCYPINVARMLFGGEPTAIQSSVRRDPAAGVDIVTSAILEFESGTATFLCSTRMEPDQRVDIYGTQGRLIVEIPFNIPPDRPTRVLQIEGGDPPIAPGMQVHEFATADPYSVQADEFSRAIRSGGVVPIPTSDAVGNLTVIDTIFARAGRS